MDVSFEKLLDGIHSDENRNYRFLHLTPNEPAMSDTARSFLLSPLGDRYYFGPGENGVKDNGALTSLGLGGVGAIVDAAEDALKRTLGASVINMNCLSGVHAMMCVLLAVTSPGDTVMTLDHDHGGHFATKGILKQTGRHSIDTIYDFTKQQFDAKAIAQRFHENKATLLYLDVSYYTAPINIRELRDELGEEALIVFDASHTLGLLVGGSITSPLREGADIICANTHKTLPGPQKGLIAFRDGARGKDANSIIDGCLVSSAHTGSLLALSTTILEMERFGEQYAKLVIDNAQALGESLYRHGFNLRRNPDGSFSRTHQIHVKTDGLGGRRDIYDKLYHNSIAVAFDSPSILHNGTFIRLGTQEITRRGMRPEHMNTISQFIKHSIEGENIRFEVEEFKQSFPSVLFSFDKGDE